MKYVIFSIDNVTDLHTLAKFTHHMDVQRAMGRLHGEMKMCVGSYKGVMEYSFILKEVDFVHYVSDSDFIRDQESVLVIEDGHYGETYASLHFLEYGIRGGKPQHLGLIKSVDKDTALSQDAWTYRPDLNEYFITEE